MNLKTSLQSIKASYRELSLSQWGLIFGIWTLAALSFTTQYYFGALYQKQTIGWLTLFLQQIPPWYLCALITPTVIGIYRAFPLDTQDWKQNLWGQVRLAFPLLLVFSNLRLLCIQWSFNPFFFQQLTPARYLSSLVSQFPWDTTIYILITLVVFAHQVNTSRRKKELYAAQLDLHNQELQNQLNQAQLETLRLQLSPHFLFNTLNTVGSLIRTREYEAAIYVNTRLGDFLRRTLAGENHLWVSLEEEIAFLDLYLDIELVRFQDRLQIRKSLCPDSLSVAVPHLILQPLVENAIKHGISRYRHARLLEINSRVQDQQLWVEIYNEGAPLPENWQMLEQEKIGLRNVRQRLEKLYGQTCSFNLQNDPIRSGVAAIIQIPII
jgi:sensor histidine kinase YesM